MAQLSDSEGFWGSGEGIGMRLGMLSGSINTGSYNNALQVLAPAYGIQYFMRVTRIYWIRNILCGFTNNL